MDRQRARMKERIERVRVRKRKLNRLSNRKRLSERESDTEQES